MTEAGSPQPKFDAYVRSYDRMLEDSIRASGESKEYFLDYKLGCLERIGIDPTLPVLDYGCGTGNLSAHLARRFSAVEGYDPSPESLRLAREQSPGSVFHESPSTIAERRFGAAVLSGVLHHIPPADRCGILSDLRRKLVPGGRVVVFEHNPWNPVTRRAVDACPFDDDAILLWPGELRRLLNQAGYQGVTQQYIVFFPRSLAALRPLEPRLSWLFLGAQTMTIGSEG
jgi:SAM-dependent methyltransferase